MASINWMPKLPPWAVHASLSNSTCFESVMR